MDRATEHHIKIIQLANANILAGRKSSMTVSNATLVLIRWGPRYCSRILEEERGKVARWMSSGVGHTQSPGVLEKGYMY